MLKKLSLPLLLLISVPSFAMTGNYSKAAYHVGLDVLESIDRADGAPVALMCKEAGRIVGSLMTFQELAIYLSGYEHKLDDSLAPTDPLELQVVSMISTGGRLTGECSNSNINTKELNANFKELGEMNKVLLDLAK